MASSARPIHELVAQLPEIYQPIFGYPEYDERASRGQDRRLEEVLRLYDALAQLKGRALNVLDLGCAQGYFSLSLASRGAMVRGIDYLDANIAVCEQLASESPHLLATFEINRIESIIEEMATGQYDLVLGLSVFHHLIHLHGVPRVQALLRHVVGAGACLLAEMALASEPLYWAAAQPEDPRSLLDGIAFVRCLGWYPTHLSGVQRPLYFASGDTWYLGDGAARFERWRNTSHDLAENVHRGTRAYYFADGVIAKKFITDGELGENNRLELEREAAVLAKELPGLRMPRVLETGEGNGEQWLLREMIPGRLLSESLAEIDMTARHQILMGVLGQLATLEVLGLYHSDVRIWNVVLDVQGRPCLIDYGAIGEQAVDCLWPHDVHLAFLIFAHELVSGEIALSDPLRRTALSPSSLAPELRAWAQVLFNKPLTQWTFADMLATLAPQWGRPWDVGAASAIPPNLWLPLLEQATQSLLHHAKHMRAQLDVVGYESARRDEKDRHIAWIEKEAMRTELRASVDGQFAQLRSEISAARRELYDETMGRLSQLAAQMGQVGQRVDHFDGKLALLRDEVLHGPQEHAIQVLQEEVALIKGSRSWRLTAPLRAINRRLANTKLQAKIRLRPLVVGVARRLIAVPFARRWAKSMMSLHPRFASRLRLFLQGAGLLGRPVVQLISRAVVPGKKLASRRADVLSARIGVNNINGDGQGAS